MTTPTAALVEEAPSMTTDTLIEEAMGEMHRLGIDNLRAKGAIVLLVEALRRAEAERDESKRDAEAYKRQTQEVSAKAIELTKEVCAKLDHAEAEREEARSDAQHAEVLRLTGERDAARAEVQTLLWIKSASVKLLDTLQGIRWMEPHEPDDERVIAATRAWVEAAGLTMHAELLKTIEELRALGFGLGCMLTNARGWLQLMCHHSEQHMELRAHIATLELLLRGGK